MCSLPPYDIGGPPRHNHHSEMMHDWQSQPLFTAAPAVGSDVGTDGEANLELHTAAIAASERGRRLFAQATGSLPGGPAPPEPALTMIQATAGVPPDVLAALRARVFPAPPGADAEGNARVFPTSMTSLAILTEIDRIFLGILQDIVEHSPGSPNYKPRLVLPACHPQFDPGSRTWGTHPAPRHAFPAFLVV